MAPCAEACRRPPPPPRRAPATQAGNALMEALVALLLLAAIALGLAYAAARAVNAQRYTTTHALAVHEMREELHRRGRVSGAAPLCEASGSPAWQWTLAAQTVDFQFACVTSAVTVNGTALSISTLDTVAAQSSTASRELFGGDGAIVFSLR